MPSATWVPTATIRVARMLVVHGRPARRRSYRCSHTAAVTSAVVLALTSATRMPTRNSRSDQSSGAPLATSGPLISGQNAVSELVRVKPRAEAVPKDRPSSGSR